MHNNDTQEKTHIVIENKKGTYKSFEIESDPIWKDYPLPGVTYPVDYGYMEGYESEDGEDLDVFVGTGELNGYIKVWRYDVPIETKFVTKVTQQEWNDIIEVFSPVITEQKVFSDTDEFNVTLERYGKKK